MVAMLAQSVVQHGCYVSPECCSTWLLC